MQAFLLLAASFARHICHNVSRLQRATLLVHMSVQQRGLVMCVRIMLGKWGCCVVYGPSTVSGLRMALIIAPSDPECATRTRDVWLSELSHYPAESVIPETQPAVTSTILQSKQPSHLTQKCVAAGYVEHDPPWLWRQLHGPADLLCRIHW